jgi:gas vesicle protein
MMRIKSVIAGLLFTALIGCSAQLVERPKEQEVSRAKQEEERKPSSLPTFTYRPGAGLMIEGR